MTRAPNVLRPQVDGPNVVTGEIVVVTATGARALPTAVLCRCGHSADKPFCDGAHVKTRFTDPAHLPADVASGPASGGPELVITPLPDGPNRCEGPLTICDFEGREATSVSTLLCRCGGSRKKPYCDGSHKTRGFRG